jgi:SAM-dependent methyltransferase
MIDSTPTPIGFTIYDLAEFARVTIREVPADIPWQRQSHCPACREALVAVCSLVGQTEPPQVMRIGACQGCGYIGYIDRPSDGWIADFYATEWDSHIAHDASWVKAQPSIMTERKSSRRLAGMAAGQLPADKSRPALEIGCGYGNVLRHLREEAGFSHVVGVEHSPHRARAVTSAWDIPVVVGPFESDQVQEQLRHHAPFSLIVSHHVFEHVVDGDAFIARAGELQKEGDYLVLAMPDVAGEHAGYITFYPPHLHSYSKKSIENLLNRHGYTVMTDHSPALDSMILVAQKGPVSATMFSDLPSSLQIAKAKLMRGLGVGMVPSSGLAMQRWLAPGFGYDDAQVTPISRMKWVFTKVSLWAQARLGRYTSAHTMLIGPLEKPLTDTPIEIQWKGPLRLLFK